MINDNVKIYESIIGNNGKIYADTSSQSTDIIGEVEVIYRSRNKDNIMFTRSFKRHNDLLVTGATYVSEKINNFRSTFKPTSLDLELGVHTADQIITDHTVIPNEKICGLMIGNNGCADTYNTVHKVHRADRKVPGMIPFRVLPKLNDLSATDRAKYFLRVVQGNYVYYYGKKFDIEREINVQYEDGTTVPLNADTISTSKFIKVFTKYVVTVDARDVREYFKITQGSTMKSLVNSVGLLTGYPEKVIDEEGGPQYDEFYNVRGMTTCNMENNELKDSESTITFIYRLFIQ